MSGPYECRQVTRSLVAMRAQVASTRTVGDILLQLIINQMTPGVMTDRVLNGPTNDVWIHPWVAYLKQLGIFSSELVREPAGATLDDVDRDEIMRAVARAEAVGV